MNDNCNDYNKSKAQFKTIDDLQFSLSVELPPIEQIIQFGFKPFLTFINDIHKIDNPIFRNTSVKKQRFEND